MENNKNCNSSLFVKLILTLMISSTSFFTGSAKAEEIIVTVNKISTTGIGESIGTITFADSNDRLLITTNLNKLTPGEHGFHIHENPSCEPAEKDGVMTAGQKAGSHYDPKMTKKHKGPHTSHNEGGGHAGDLPLITADENGEAKLLFFVEGLSVKDIKGRSVMIHEAGDNYSDDPKPLGGGGGRVACAVM